jgi:hypothetical protein
MDLAATVDELRREIDLIQAESVRKQSVLERQLALEKTEVTRLEAEVEMLKNDCEMASELFEKAMNRVRAESAAYAAKIPPEAER